MRNRLYLLSLFVIPSFIIVSGCLFAADNSHWSRQFPKPPSSTKMSGSTGMSDASGAPTIKAAKWHQGKLYLAGRWENALDPRNPSKRVSNMVWHMWTWHPKEGWRAVAWAHTAKGGPGPLGVINDFLFLPDGRLVVAGEFTKIGNPHGHTYHRSKGLAVYDPKEPTATRWRPLVPSVQHNSPGNIQTIAYDPQADDLWVGGSFKGFRMEKLQDFCFGVQRYNLTEKKWHIVVPGLRGGRGARKIKVDTSTKPSTIYIAGRFKHTGGNGLDPCEVGSTDRYSQGFCAWRADVGWITFPKNQDKSIGDEGPLQRASDFAFFDSVNIFDFLVDGKDIWIVGAFSEGKTTDGRPLRGIARWDDKKQMWVDPTGRGGFGREAYSIAKAADGRIYVAGAFGGENAKGHYDGFKNGDPAYMAVCYDPATKQWSQLGDGLGGYNQPVCRLTVHGNDIFFYGTFRSVGRNPKKKEGFESYYIARWNSGIDFSGAEAPLPEGADNPFTITEPATDAPMFTEGLEHWDRGFRHPPRQSAGKSMQSPATGMDDGAGQPEIRGLTWHNNILYLCGSWQPTMHERWFVWTYDPAKGWSAIGYTQKNDRYGWDSPPEGLAWHNDKLYVWGANKKYKGIASWDPSTREWAPVKGNYEGAPVVGNAVVQGNPAVNDVAWDSRSGDMYMVGSTGLRYKTGHPGGTVPSAVIRVDKDGNYHAMGLMLVAEIPSKPVKGIYCIYLDESKTPTDIYIGGTFGSYGADSHKSKLVYNVAKWSHEAKDWRPIGKGVFRGLGQNARQYFPEGFPGLPAHPIDGFPTFLTELFPRVRRLTMDKKGNLYAGGSIAILDDNTDILKRVEHYGIVKYDKTLDKWVPCTNCGGVSRDVFDMTWLDDKHLLLSGGFLYAEDYRLLNNIAILDIDSGELTALGGGLYKGHNGHVLSMNVHHTVREDGYWFAGWFKYAGADADSSCQAPIESNYIAHYDPNSNLDPNGALELVTPEALEGVKGYSSKSYKVQLEAKGVDPSVATVVWYERKRDKYRKLGKGLKYKANVRVKAGMTSVVFYAAVLRKDGVEGGKVPVTVAITPPK